MFIVRYFLFHTRTPDRYEPAVTVTAELTHTFNLSLDGGVLEVVVEVVVVLEMVVQVVLEVVEVVVEVVEVVEVVVEVVEVGSLTRPLTWTVWRCLSGRVAR